MRIGKSPKNRIPPQIDIYDSFEGFNTKASEANSPTQNDFPKLKGERGRSKTPTSYPSGLAKTKGMMEKAIHERLETYKKVNKMKKMEVQRIFKLNQTLNEEENVKPKPQINQKSQKLYEKRRRQRKLSPNVWQRFENYEREKSKDKLLRTINRIIQVTPTKKITEKDLQTFATPKEIKFLKQLFKTQPPLQ